MKTYKHLFETLISEDNIKIATKNACKGKVQPKRHRRLREIRDNLNECIPEFQKLCSNYHNAYHRPKRIYDGISRKQRTILVPTAKEHIIHHMVVQVLKPIFKKPMYEHSYGSIENRGGLKAKNRIAIWMRKDSKGTRYCLKMDVKKYFDSIPHDILKAKLSKIIKDEDFLKVLFAIIDVQEKGIPLGFYTSQWLANFYLTSLDHYIKEELGARYYVRYMDDMVILDGNKRKLHKMRIAIEKYLNEELGLEMKENWQVFKVEYKDKNNKRHGRPIDFMGYKFYKNRITLRKSILRRIRRKALKIFKKAKASIYDCKQMLSYLGWIKHTDVYNYYKEYIKPYVDIRRLKKRVSNYDRRNNRCGITQNIAQCQTV